MDTRRNFPQGTLTLAGALAASNPRQPLLAAEAPGPDRADPSKLGPNMERHLNIGALIYPRMDQIDFTGPFEVLSQIPDSTFHVAWKEKRPVRDYKGLILTPEKALAEVPPLAACQENRERSLGDSRYGFTVSRASATTCASARDRGARPGRDGQAVAFLRGGRSGQR